ncbi:hypothetical protein [Beggiatoa leptomitoformis]|uniref:Rpn family recombination-promoting nuclease/putative transposase n=1 Tax=Beggiatoa leptomitoformis TaxID=288004 RepID=A0A2N9YDC4_9GAMM|nr:hypothetical protein [Beggiatoa leptomitoformis]ALG69129.1 hypothetical protein AL038_17345 [Beggiatoa leptomitoformis]AUI68456.1 hypothetical protein BLE401_06875 [Beggiatoa leptomitoformis]
MSRHSAHNLDKTRQRQMRLMNYWSNKAALDTAFAEGKKEGIIEGIVLGERQAKREIAKQLKIQGFTLELITQITGLSQADID